MERDVFSGRLRLNGEEHGKTLRAANNYAVGLALLNRFEEAKALFRRTIPVARRVLGESHELTLRMRLCYAEELYQDPAATLDEIREALTMLEEIEPIARRVLGGANPVVVGIEHDLRVYRARLRGAPPPRT